MHWILWTIMALVGLTAVILLMVKVVRRRANRSTPAMKTAWLVAATVSGMMLVSIAAQVIEIMPNATAIDVAALAVTGVLTGLFLAFGLMHTQTGAADR